MQIVERLKNVLTYILVGLFTLGLFGYYIETSIPMPNNAVIYASDTARTYLAPPYIQDFMINPTTLRKTTAQEVRSRGYKPDEKCRDQGYFTQDGRSLTGGYLEKLGILPPLKKRWNSDGTWNW